MKAIRINEFTPKEVINTCGEQWLGVELDPDNYLNDYKSLPEIVEYNSERFYMMSFNSDRFVAYYKEAKQRAYHERYRN